jgi:hypothetical protein
MLKGGGLYTSGGGGVSATAVRVWSPLHLRPGRVLLPCKLKDLSTREGLREQPRCHAEH